VKSTLALSIVSVLLCGGHQRAHRNEGGDSYWSGSNLPPTDISVNTDFAASIAPFSIRLVLVLTLGGDPPTTEAVLPPNNNGPPNRESRC
jgi:hypothetical protein